MSLGIYFYLVSTIIFAGGACFIEIMVLRRELKPYKKILFTMMLISLFLTVVMEPPAIAWSAWIYNFAYMLNVHILNAEVESLLYGILVSAAIAMNALVCAGDEDSGRPILKMRWKRMKDILKP